MAEIREKQYTKTNPQTASHSRGPKGVRRNNELELEKNEILVKYFAVKGPNLKGCRRTVKLLIGVILITKILYSIKVIVQ